METFIKIKLFATLDQFTPANADRYPISPGDTVNELLAELNIPLSSAKLIFVNSVRSEPDTILRGGERIGIFPPVGGG